MRNMHNARLWIGCTSLAAAALLAAQGSWSSAQESPESPTASTRPADGAAAAKPARKRSARVIKPYSELDDLSAEQEAGIKSIHAEILDRKAELDRLEREQILSLLSDAQKQKVTELEADRDRQTKERSAAARQRAATRKAAPGDEPDNGDDAAGQ